MRRFYRGGSASGRRYGTSRRRELRLRCRGPTCRLGSVAADHDAHADEGEGAEQSLDAPVVRHEAGTASGYLHTREAGGPTDYRTRHTTAKLLRWMHGEGFQREVPSPVRAMKTGARMRVSEQVKHGSGVVATSTGPPTCTWREAGSCWSSRTWPRARSVSGTHAAGRPPARGS